MNIVIKESTFLATAILVSLLLGSNISLADQVTLDAGAIFRDCPDCPEMVVVPKGDFDMGFDGGVNDERYEGPVRRVSIGYDFAAGRYEVTNAEYASFLLHSGHKSGTDCSMWDGMFYSPTKRAKIFYSKIQGTGWHDAGYGRPPKPTEPVVCITWTDVKAYVDWLARKTGKSYRLLSEAEWEYAARAGRTGPYAWGDDPDIGCREANIYDQSAFDPTRPWETTKCNDGWIGVAPVGSYPANPFGLYDVIGNVWEWVEDCYIVPIPQTPSDGQAIQVKGQCDNRVVKGGSWASPISWERPTFRGRDPEDRISHIFGFRIARDLQ